MGKYVNEAASYSGSVSRVEGELETAKTSLGNVDRELGLDPENVHDLLTYNVIVGNKEIKDEIDSLVSDLGNYKSLISTKAEEIDRRIEEEERRRLAAQSETTDESTDNSSEIE